MPPDTTALSKTELLVHREPEVLAPLKQPRKPQVAYSQELYNEICTRIAEGEPLTRICRQDDMPCYSQAKEWSRKSPENSAMYAHAREEQADCWADQVIDAADDTDESNPVSAMKQRLMVDARKWVASKLKPKKYGDKVFHEDETPLADAVIKIHWADEVDDAATNAAPDAPAAANLGEP